MNARFGGTAARATHFVRRSLLLVLALCFIATSGLAQNDAKRPVAESRFAKFDGSKVHYVNYGKGQEALVLIHGWTMNLDNWRDQFADFTRRGRVIAVDLPGHGQSDKPQTAYSMDLFARAVEAVMRDAKVKRAVLVGHSMGTPVARQFYRRYPDKTLAIVIVDGVLTPLADKAAMDRIFANLRAANFRDNLKQMMTQMKGPGLSDEQFNRILTSSANTPQYVIVSAMEGMADPSIWGTDQINLPVLAIMAKNPYFPPNIADLAKQVAPQVEFHMWDGVGHFVMMEKPKEFNKALLTFLDKNRLLKN